MSNATYTRWFGGDTRPGQEGVYQTENGFQWWSPYSQKWFGWASDVRGAQDCFLENYVSCSQNHCWRGFTTKQD